MKRLVVFAFFIICVPNQMNAQFRSLKSSNENNSGTEIIQYLDLSPTTYKKKSVLLAVAASLILPGMGELYAGSFGSGQYHLIAEGGLWMTYAGFRMHSNWLGEDARTFAVQHSGANFNDKDDKYPVNIGNFNSTEEYNQTKLRNREFNLVYSDQQYNWLWDSDASRLRFKDLRIRSDAAKNNAKFIIGAVVINHLISAFSAGRKAAAYNKSLSETETIQVQSYTIIDGSQVDGIGFSITAEF